MRIMMSRSIHTDNTDANIPKRKTATTEIDVIINHRNGAVGTTINKWSDTSNYNAINTASHNAPLIRVAASPALLLLVRAGCRAISAEICAASAADNADAGIEIDGVDDGTVDGVIADTVVVAMVFVGTYS